MSIITVESLKKDFLVAEKLPGLRGSIKHFFSRKTTTVKAVNSVSFEIGEGEIVGFIGSNGAGKTTTLKMLCGLIYPTAGFLSVAGYTPFNRENDFLKQITLVMGQKQQLIWDLPPMDSFQVNSAVYGLGPKETKQRISELSSMLELDEELTRPVRKLSLGQRMKAELLASLLHQPSILFLDEPTLGLDINAQFRIREFLADYNRRFGATILLTSHYMGDITSLCKRIILIDKGNLFYDGSLKDFTKKTTKERLISITFSDIPNIEDLRKHGLILEVNANQIRLLVNNSELPDILSKILNRYTILDIEIKEPPIEEIIAKTLSIN